MIEDRIKQRALMHPSFSGSLWFFLFPIQFKPFYFICTSTGCKIPHDFFSNVQYTTGIYGLCLVRGTKASSKCSLLRSIFSCILVHFRLDPESKMFTSLCRIADLFPLTLSLSDMSPSRIHLCCYGKEMNKNLSLNPCMHVPFDFIVCISVWWFCSLFTTYFGCHWCRVNKLSQCYFSVFTFVAFL